MDNKCEHIFSNNEPRYCVKCLLWKRDLEGDTEATEDHAPSGQAGLTGCGTEKLNKISGIVDDMLRHLESTPKMNVNGTDYIDLHCMRTTLEDINRELCK